MMTSARVVETSVNVTSNGPSQDYTHPDDHNLPNYDMTPGFKPFTIFVFYSTDEQGERNRNGERERRRNLHQGQHEVRRCSGKIKFRALAKFV